MYRLHGTADRIIKPVGPVEHWIHGAGHAFTVTHPKATSRILRGIVAR